MRYKLTIAYRGTAYHGWQTQLPGPTWKGPPGEDGIPTVQTHLRRALAQVVRHDVKLCGSSRTDAGVHAKGQVAHFDTDKDMIPPEKLRQSANAKLPGDILIRAAEPVPDTFDAIGDTTGKRYQYVIWTGAGRPPFFADLAWHRWQPLDVAAMTAAAAGFVGTHDFASFARPGHGRTTTVRTVTDVSVAYRSPKLVIGVTGSGFLWHMVRIMVGTLVEIGLGRRKPDAVAGMIAARDRLAAGPTAPPHGLYLQWITHGNDEARMTNDETE